MRETMITWCDRIIRYGFYVLFFLIPLAVTNSTSELYELNKMWLTWEISLFIGAAWFSKMLVQRQFFIKRTPLDIPLLLFLLSQTISTILSLDPHTSFWGYYSRFNGGLLSTITYIFLYYALVSQFDKQHIYRLLQVSLLSGLVVALWGLPSHFGKDPTCLLFRGTLDVDCWTDAFKPTVRIFSTLGQPAWLSAYLNVLLPVSLAMFLLPKLSRDSIEEKTRGIIPGISQKLAQRDVIIWLYLLLSTLFMLCLIYTNTRAGIIGFWIANLIFWLIVAVKRYFKAGTFLKMALLCNGIFLILHFFLGTSFTQLDRFTFTSLTTQKSVSSQTDSQAISTPAAGNLGGTDSGKIRQIVWQGALDIWKKYPYFGSGTETFAFAYYQYRPADHNLTSEWDYLYNKAHNEYLNYLSTTGIFGLGTYLAFILLFLFLTVRFLLKDTKKDTDSLLVVALLSGFVSILITNFFAFSVVIMNLYLFLIPVFIFLLKPALLSGNTVNFPKQRNEKHSSDITTLQWIGITAISLVAMFCLLVLVRYWYADKAYALGSNYNRVQEYQQAYLKLGEAVSLRPSEPTFKDEFAINNGMIAALLLFQDTTATPSAETVEQARLLTEQAITLSNQVVAEHPNNISFWKDRVRLFYTLAQVDKRYLPYAVDAVKRVKELAPTDAKVFYNLGSLQLENGNASESAKILEQAILLKPDYRDAYYSLALTYNVLATDSQGNLVNPEFRQKAIKQLQFILERLSPDDQEAKKQLQEWQVQASQQ